MISGSQLFYENKLDGIEVSLGDHVLCRRWFRSPQPGRVAYIPGISAFHAEMEPDEGDQSGVREWGILFEDGSLWKIVYWPPTAKVPSSIRFVKRGEPIDSKTLGEFH